jgi:hypothetical protein
VLYTIIRILQILQAFGFPVGVGFSNYCPCYMWHKNNYKTRMLMDYIHRPDSFYRSRRFGDGLCLHPQVNVAD